jgi:hypothetical protein
MARMARAPPGRVVELKRDGDIAVVPMTITGRPGLALRCRTSDRDRCAQPQSAEHVGRRGEDRRQ